MHGSTLGLVELLMILLVGMGIAYFQLRSLSRSAKPKPDTPPPMRSDDATS